MSDQAQNASLPRSLASASARDLEGAWAAISDLLDTVRFMPDVEFKTFDWIVRYDTSNIGVIYASSRIAQPVFVTAAAKLTDSPDTPVYMTTHFRLDDAGGLVVSFTIVSNLGVPLNAGTNVRMTLRIEGER